MQIADDIKSIAVVGMQKNTGKTETLNWLVRYFEKTGATIGLTSIGIDGETIDQVTDTAKPEITVAPGTLFVTSERHFRMKAFAAEILAVSSMRTALGRLVTARALSFGKILLSGPAQTGWLKDCIAELQDYGAKRTLVDGALFRMSSASPAVADALVLATGAALTINFSELVKKTLHAVNIINLPVSLERESFVNCDDGLWIVTEQAEVVKLNSQTALSIDKNDLKEIAVARTLYISGAVTDSLLKHLLKQKKIPEIVVRDFAKIFVSVENFERLRARGVGVSVLNSSRLLAVTVNPWSPSGYTLDSERIVAELSDRIAVPVFDVRK